ncbi:hypothetical protein ACFVW8_12795, partial [Streptomyces sp. NPDC058221]|uniref:hypothetical protein n=1 Tax=Streptomyces sp. NPDC058221 TaxID=3346388 RepID=UPI0036F0D99F
AARTAAVRGDHGAPGAMVVVSCGRSPESWRTRPPVRPERRWPDGPVPRDGAGPGAGCGHG